MRLLEWALIQSDWWLVREENLDTQKDTRGMCTLGDYHTKRKQEGDCLQTKERNLKRNQTCQHLDPELRENTFLLFMPPDLWYFVTAALANKYSGAPTIVSSLAFYNVFLSLSYNWKVPGSLVFSHTHGRHSHSLWYTPLSTLFTKAGLPAHFCKVMIVKMPQLPNMIYLWETKNGNWGNVTSSYWFLHV